MLMQVKFINGFRDSLTYEIPPDWDTTNLVGCLIRVPLQNRVEIACVERVFQADKAKIDFKLKQALSKDLLPEDKLYLIYLNQLSNYYSISKLTIFKKLNRFLKEKQHEVVIQESIMNNNIKKICLTDEQEKIVNEIKPNIQNNKYFPCVIHGVTGSGKTEIYKSLIENAIQNKKIVLLLLPEVSLAVQFTKLLKEQLDSEILIYGFHSGSSIKEKKALWGYLLKKKPMVIIGVHLPQFLPIPNLGLIIVDEEHDVGFQEKKYPKINAKEAALLRASIHEIPIVLGSATPSITTLYNIKQKGWKLFELKKRFSGAFPDIKLVKLTNDKKREQFWISEELHNAINECLAKKEQVIIFLNRRGYSFFIQCKKCGFIPNCTNCSVSLTLHNDNSLLCHYCGYKIISNDACIHCKAGNSSLLKKGIGTQQVVSIFEKVFSCAKIARADLDSTVDRKKWQKTLFEFEQGNIDILVGTQTITKGYHFPKVTCVGILWADINLSLPIYNAAEITLQQIIQVAGRAGRQSKESKVIVQTMIDHPIYKYISEVNYLQFYDYEIEKRQVVNYPPCIRLAEIEMRNDNEELLDFEANSLTEFLIEYTKSKHAQVTILGPAQPTVHMINNIFNRKIYLKSISTNHILLVANCIDKTKFKSDILFTPNPLS